MRRSVRQKENIMSASDEDEEIVRPQRKKSRTGRRPSAALSVSNGQVGTPTGEIGGVAANLVQDYRDLAHEMGSLDIRPENTVHNARRVTSLIDQADVLADKTYNASGSAAAPYDGEFMNVAGQVVHRIAETMAVNSRVFCVKDFASCLAQLIQGSKNKRITQTSIAKFNKDYCRRHFPLCAPVLRFVHGAHDFAATVIPSEQTARPAPKKRTRLVVSPTKTEAAIIRGEESMQNVDKDKTVLEVESMHQSIEVKYAENGEQPLPYLSIVTDVKDFGKTVENIFHFSFLVKEGYDRILVHNGVTSVIPVPEDERTAKTTTLPNQLIFSFSQKDWVQWCQKVKSHPYRFS